MFYLVQKFEHECLIEDIFEGDTFEDAIRNKFEETNFIMGNDVEEREWEYVDMLKWIKEDNYEFTTIYKSKSEIIIDEIYVQR